jgi:hypothetical protein
MSRSFGKWLGRHWWKVAGILVAVAIAIVLAVRWVAASRPGDQTVSVPERIIYCDHYGIVELDVSTGRREVTPVHTRGGDRLYGVRFVCTDEWFAYWSHIDSSLRVYSAREPPKWVPVSGIENRDVGRITPYRSGVYINRYSPDDPHPPAGTLRVDFASGEQTWVDRALAVCSSEDTDRVAVLASKDVIEERVGDRVLYRRQVEGLRLDQCNWISQLEYDFLSHSALVCVSHINGTCDYVWVSPKGQTRRLRIRSGAGGVFSLRLEPAERRLWVVTSFFKDSDLRLCDYDGRLVRVLATKRSGRIKDPYPATAGRLALLEQVRAEAAERESGAE